MQGAQSAAIATRAHVWPRGHACARRAFCARTLREPPQLILQPVRDVDLVGQDRRRQRLAVVVEAEAVRDAAAERVVRDEIQRTPMQKIAIPFVIFTLIYIFLSVALFFLLRRQFMKTDEPASELITKNV